MFTTSLAGQEVYGRVLESGTRQPIPLATMLLLDSTYAVVDRTYTDETGAFVLRAAKPGGYFVLGERLGYKRTLDGILEFRAGGSISVEFHLRKQPLALDTITVASRRQRTNAFLNSVGFYQRLNERAAWFLTPDDLEKRMETDVNQLFRNAPRAKLLDQPPITSIVFRGGGLMPRTNPIYGKRSVDPEGYCTPRVLVNGLEVAAVVKGVPGAMIADVVDEQDIAAIEVHTGPASLPLAYGGTTTTCTTILIWTWSGTWDRER